MLDIGWTEILVIAIVLIVVVGPKDLPPMLRAFGKTTKRLRTMAGEFRQQFDEALKEAELDDVRQTLSDAQRLNPVNSLKDALNPLRQMGNDIRSDLQKATKVDAPTIAEPWTPPEPAAKLPDEPPTFPKAEQPAAADAPIAETPASKDAAPAKPARKPRAAKAEPAPAAIDPAAKPARVSRTKPAASAPAVDASPTAATPHKARVTKAVKPGPEEAATKVAKPKKPATRSKKTGDA